VSVEKTSDWIQYFNLNNYCTNNLKLKTLNNKEKSSLAYNKDKHKKIELGKEGIGLKRSVDDELELPGPGAKTVANHDANRSGNLQNRLETDYLTISKELSKSESLIK
jgi:hypothetical protein